MTRHRAIWTLLATLVVVVTGCGVQTDARPRDLPEAERAIDIADETANIDASGANRVYLVGPGEEHLLRSVQRDAKTASDLVEILLLGPTAEEVQAQFSTAIPSGTQLIDARTVGQTFTVDLSPQIIELDTQNLIRALAQIVYTVTELPGIESVQIEIDGERLSAPTATGGSTTDALRVYDFPGLVQTSQPDYPVAAVSASA